MPRWIALLLAPGLLLATPGVATAAEPPNSPEASAVTNGRVEAIARVGGTIFLGGSFTTVTRRDGSTVNRSRLAAIDAATGDPTSWNPKADATVRALVASADGNTIYAGGDFKTVAGQARKRLVALNRSTGQPTAWAPSASASVRALAVKGSRIYAGGTFSTVSGVSRPRLAAIDAGSGTVVSEFKPNPDAGVRALAVDPVGNRLYVAGSFGRIGGSSRQYLAAVSSTKGTASSWKPQPGWIVLTLTVSADGSRVFAGGDSTGGHVAAWAADGTAKWHVVLDGDVNSIALGTGGATLYAGGHFHHSGAIGREKLAAYSTASGQLSSWNPGADSVYGVYSVSVAGDRLAVGGDFTRIGGAARTGYAQFAPGF